MNGRSGAALRLVFLGRLLLAVAALVLCAPATTGAQPLPIPIDAYWAQMEATYGVVQNLNDVDPDESAARLAALAEFWSQIILVVLEDGVVVPVDHSALLRAMLADPPNLARVEALLANLLAARDQWPAGRHTQSDLLSLEAILRRAEFLVETVEPPAIRVWWDNLIDGINRFLADLFPETAGNGVGALVSWLLYVVGLIALAGVVAYTVNELLKSLAGEAHLRADGSDGGAPLTADSAFQRAQHLAEGRDYRTAVRYLYLSALLTLDERGLLRYDRSKTNREYLRSVAAQPALASALREVIDVFDRVWYGFQPLDAASYARYETRVAELRQP